MKKDLNRRTPTGAPTRPKQSTQEKAPTSSFTASAYWKFESIPLQQRVERTSPVRRQHTVFVGESPRNRKYRSRAGGAREQFLGNKSSVAGVGVHQGML